MCDVETRTACLLYLRQEGSAPCASFSDAANIGVSTSVLKIRGMSGYDVTRRCLLACDARSYDSHIRTCSHALLRCTPTPAGLWMLNLSPLESLCCCYTPSTRKYLGGRGNNDNKMS